MYLYHTPDIVAKYNTMYTTAEGRSDQNGNFCPDQAKQVFLTLETDLQGLQLDFCKIHDVLAEAIINWIMFGNTR